MEQFLNVWIEDQRNRNVTLTSNKIRNKAQSIYLYLKSQATKDDSTFSASKGWFDRFRKRANLLNIKVGEITSTNENAVELFLVELKTIIEEGGYTSHQIFNCDETELYWKKLPDRTFLSKEERVAPGFKAATDKITLLFCSNASVKNGNFPNENVRQSWADFTILTSIGIIEQSWFEVTNITLKASWKNLLPETESELEETESIIQLEVDKILRIASTIGGEGFCDMTKEEIMELICNQHEELKNDELENLLECDVCDEDGEECVGKKLELTKKGISEILNAAEILKEKIMDIDPDFQSIKIGRRIDEDVAVYVDIRKSMTKDAQTDVIDFINDYIKY